MDNLGFLGIAFGFAWIAITIYLFTLIQRTRSIEKRLEDSSVGHGRQSQGGTEGQETPNS